MKHRNIKSRKMVISAYKFLLEITPPTQKISDIRIEEIEPQKKIVVLSFNNEGEFSFDRMRKYKEFKLLNDDRVIAMKSKKL